MKLFNLYRVTRFLTESKGALFSYVPQRGVRYMESLKWVSPGKKKIYDRGCSEDLVPMQKINPDTLYLKFKDSKELEAADEKVKKIFSVGFQIPKSSFIMYRQELIDKVRNNPYDKNSLEISIAKLTAEIRYYQEIILKRPSKFPFQRISVSKAIKKRKKYLRLLREKDYKKFEWLLETLDLQYKPIPNPNLKVTRKQSLTLLAKLKVEQLKEEKLAALKKSYDDQKIPFLENKIMKLKKIKAMEEKYNLPVTVTDADIEKCIEKIEEVKIQIAERTKRGYVRNIHPYFLEAYDKSLLWEKEKAGEKIREEILKKKQTLQQ